MSPFISQLKVDVSQYRAAVAASDAGAAEQARTDIMEGVAGLFQNEHAALILWSQLDPGDAIREYKKDPNAYTDVEFTVTSGPRD